MYQKNDRCLLITIMVVHVTIILLLITDMVIKAHKMIQVRLHTDDYRQCSSLDIIEELAY